MKMTIFSSGIFWGVLLVFVGLSILLKVVFGIDFPFFRILLGLLFIYLGVRIITGISSKGGPNSTTTFGVNTMSYDEKNPEQNIIFSKGVVDYTKAVTNAQVSNAKVNVVFSDGTMIIDENIPMKITVSSAFSGSRFPNGTTISFGEYTYTTKAYSDSLPYLAVKVDAVFSAFKIIHQGKKASW